MKDTKKLTYLSPTVVIIMFTSEDIVLISDGNTDNIIGEKDYFD